VKDTGIDERLRAVLVGKSGDRFIRCAVDILEGYDVLIFRSEDIYSAAAQLGRGGFGRQVFIGRYELLSRENGRFFEKLGEKRVPCCCLVGRPQADGGIFRKMKGKDVYFIFHQEQLAGFIESAAAGKRAGRRSGEGEAGNFRKDEFRTSEAELEALFGGMD